ncbi:7TM diverse intracellular signaling domain-containing protein [Fibrella aquatilis]|uniref:Histidine kinase n=1 Tax=Fibrella aquatilis TaxID=2817059 RepID=A0A939G3P0_9BACT|nr:7TM diverse intracellular signaling domain-containing protein [Fibrella aquatilis]MBO0930029.1 histidine kinase [Fibrella aquatilis]
MTFPTRFGLLISLWLGWLSGVGQPVLHLTAPHDGYTPRPLPAVWLDTAATATFTQALLADRAGLFRPYGPGTPNFGSSPVALWLRLRIRANNPDAWLLESTNHLIEDISFFGTSSRTDSVRRQRQGLFYPPKQKDLRNNLRYFRAFASTDRPGDTATIYLRVKNNMPLVIPLRLVTAQQVATESHPKDLLAGLLLGVMFAMAGYNFCLLLVIRDRVYLFYVLYVLTGVVSTDFQGYLNEFIFDRYLPAFPLYVSYALCVMLASALLFAQRFLNTPRHAPRLDKGIRVLLVACLVPVLFRWFDLRLAMTVSMQVLISATAIYLFGLGVYLFSRGLKEARFYMLAWTVLLLATLLFLGRVNGWLPVNLLTTSTVTIGVALETVLLSFALADRINVYRRETAQAQERLVSSVRETEQTKNRVLQLELSALRSQMNPHFLFNSLNSIQQFILAKDPLAAAGYLTKFARLMRFNLEQSREPTVSLQREIEMLRVYLELESLRFGQPFTYAFVLDSAINAYDIAIPCLMIQPFVENAIWHGLMHKPEGHGHIQVSFNLLSDSSLRCLIDDNGVGRQAAATYQSAHRTRHRSAGMGITTERLALLTNDPTGNSHVQVTDLTDDTGQAIGTRVVVDLPVLTP